jgi:hypothetical protein
MRRKPPKDALVNPMAEHLEAYKVAKPLGLHYFRYAREPAKRCYELALNFATKYDCKLVHGFITARGFFEGATIRHAWAEMGEVVYDGTCKGFYTRRDYYKVTRAQPIRVFDSKEASAFLLDSGFYIPCYELEKAAAQVAAF